MPAAQPACACVCICRPFPGACWPPMLCSRECVPNPALLVASFPFPFPLALSLSVSVFLFSRKSIRGKGKGQKRKRKKSRYKPWSVYVVPPLSHCLEPPRPPVRLLPAGPLTLPPRPPPSSPPPLPAVALSHSHSTNWHQWLDLVVAWLVQGSDGWAGGQSGPGGFGGRGELWLGWAPPFPHPLGTGGGPIWHRCQARVPSHSTGFHCSWACTLVWKLRVVGWADVAQGRGANDTRQPVVS